MNAPQQRHGATRYGFNHAEAFMLMKYQSKDRSVTEFLWNSRDGVTPFGIMAREGPEAEAENNVELFHVEWGRDKFAPNHLPQVGDRIFVDLTPARHREYLRKRIDAMWDHPEYPARDRWESKEAAVEDLFAEESKQPGQPDVIVVDAEWVRNWLRNQVAMQMKSVDPDICDEAISDKETRGEKKDRILASQLAEMHKQVERGGLSDEETRLVSEYRVWKRSTAAVSGVFHFRRKGATHAQ